MSWRSDSTALYPEIWQEKMGATPAGDLVRSGHNKLAPFNTLHIGHVCIQSSGMCTGEARLIHFKSILKAPRPKELPLRSKTPPINVQEDTIQGYPNAEGQGASAWTDV